MPRAESTSDRRNQIGQVMGRKGHDTRARLVAAASRLIATKPLRELRASDIAREAGLGPPNFYVYFPDVGAAVLAALDQHPQSSPQVLEILKRDWRGAAGAEHARAFVDAYLDSWRDNYALLRARNLAADEGDDRFVDQRRSDIGPILKGLADKFAASDRSGAAAREIKPQAAAGVILAALERLAAAPRWGPGLSPSTEREFRAAAAFVLTSALDAA